MVVASLDHERAVVGGQVRVVPASDVGGLVVRETQRRRSLFGDGSRQQTRSGPTPSWTGWTDERRGCLCRRQLGAVTPPGRVADTHSGPTPDTEVNTSSLQRSCHSPIALVVAVAWLASAISMSVSSSPTGQIRGLAAPPLRHER